jgi:RNA-splicing ligase RtcB
LIWQFLQLFLRVMQRKYKIPILDRELACAPFESPEGRDYFAAMQGAINMSFANRQVILHRIREVFSAAFGRSAEELGMHMVYDVAHNTAKLEEGVYRRHAGWPADQHHAVDVLRADPRVTQCLLDRASAVLDDRSDQPFQLSAGQVNL